MPRLTIGPLARLGGVAVAGLLAATSVGSGARPAAAQALPAAPSPHQVAMSTVTLLTGDQVTTAGDGTPLGVVRAPGRSDIAFNGYALDGHQYLVPQDARTLIDQGRLDAHLFDLTELIRLGYDDARSSSLPLLVQAAPGAAAVAAVPAGAQVTRVLPALDMSALAVAKSGAPQVWANLEASSASTVRHVWLNGRAEVLDDQSGSQIGAPVAYQAGYTGKGVTVAMLDSGYDPTHPDLQGVVSQAEDFTASANGVVDKSGHGTHVASIIAGRGTASTGKYAGIAKDASLIVGKVCDEHGSCSYDAILAGMTWAASTQHASIVSMSLGARATDGTDPLSQAVDQLTAQTGSLFVIAAGNAGPRAGVSSPAAADAALAVAAVTKQDTLAGFSSGGPRVGDNAVKPDIAAPGQNIIAARAAGTSLGAPVGQHYTSLSGTSMATPHVSGAAAILLQEHPGWKAGQLKAALMSTAKVIGGASVYGEGAGRVDVGRAVTQSVSAEQGSLSLGYLEWPHSPAQRTTRQVTYRNDGDQAVTLQLKLEETGPDAKPAPGGEFALGQQTLSVPAHGAAVASITVDPTLGIGLFGGWLKATTGDGTVAITTAVGVYVEDERYGLTLRVLGRDGKPAPGATVIAADRATNQASWVALHPDGTGTVRLHPGEYSVLANIVDAGSPYPVDAISVTQMAAPSVRLDRSVSLMFDARTAKPVTIGLPDESSRLLERSTYMSPRLDMGSGLAYLELSAPPLAQHYTGMVGAPASGFGYIDDSLAAHPEITLRVQAPQAVELPVQYVNTSPHLLGDHSYALVDGKGGTPQDLAGLDVRGRMVLVHPAQDTIPDLSERVAAIAAAGGAAVVFAAAGALMSSPLALPTLGLSRYRAKPLIDLLASGPVTVASHGIAASPHSFSLSFLERDRMPDGKRYQADPDRMGRVDATYRSAGVEGVHGHTGSLAYMNGHVIPMSIYYEPVVYPMRRTEYFSPSPVSFARLHGMNGAGAWQESAPQTYHPDQEYRQVFGSAPQAPLLAGFHEPVVTGGVLRWQDSLVVSSLPLLSESGGNGGPAAYMTSGPVTGTLSLGQGQRQCSLQFDWSCFWSVPPDPNTYQLHLDVTRDQPQATSLSTHVTSTWTFRSSRAAGAVAATQPLLQVACNPAANALDIHNAAPHGRPLRLDLDVSRQPGGGQATVKQVEAWASFDDGTWQPMRVVGDHGRWRAQVPPGGRPGGFVSLRVAAADTDGNAVDETIVHAWLLR